MSAVLILSHPEDLHANRVELVLDGLDVRVYRMDVRRVGVEQPLLMSIHGREVLACLDGIPLNQITCAWHRRPSEPFATGEIDAAELRAATAGVLAGLPYLNHPVDMAAAAYKVQQLMQATRVGLLVPETRVTTVLDHAKELAEAWDDAVVVKPISKRAAGLVTVGDRTGWTRPVHLTQRIVPTRTFARVTAVDGAFYSAKIVSPHLDWRTDSQGCTYEVIEIPGHVALALRELLSRQRLRFATVDFAIDRDGRWWYLETNPNGQWLWIEDATSLPIAAAIARALCAGK